MKEELVGHKLALLAKEKGFNEFTNKVFNQYGKQFIFNNSLLTNHERIKAPTQSLLQKWLREKYQLRLYVDSYAQDEPNEFVYFYILKTGDGYENIPIISGNFDSYEEALEKGLYKALKLIK